MPTAGKLLAGPAGLESGAVNVSNCATSHSQSMILGKYCRFLTCQKYVWQRRAQINRD
jgi:hypothetical protein